ncbi:endolytic transglycosylase MltG [Hominiventricola filiformis]|uniref:Endolytic transglycosylase MltG n=1 Tax=Hominiventricola filiformis TaxID=2885352 RepID=A0AAE3A226_9FIRM|nr:endolytic transglycosylase MltG [Hominiventricola filiformis]MCC2124637.1 endolytic transglycosylase MltG [Hominiventricola filiformis]
MKEGNWMLSLGLFLLRLALLILVVVGIFKVGEYAYTYCYSVVSDTAAEEEPGRDVSVSVTSDMSAGKVAKLLERKGLVKSVDVFKIQMKVTGYEDKIQPGKYVLNTSMRPREMLKILAGEETEEDEE